jgi:hypothetical protein
VFLLPINSRVFDTGEMMNNRGDWFGYHKNQNDRPITSSKFYLQVVLSAITLTGQGYLSVFQSRHEPERSEH